MDLGLKGRNAIVTAASRGPWACHRAVAGTRRRAPHHERAHGRRAGGGGAGDPRRVRRGGGDRVAADFNTREGRQAILDAAGETVDILVNNPGVRQVPTPYDKITRDDWRQWLEVHFLSSVEMIQAVAPGMTRRALRADRQHVGELHQVPAGRLRAQPCRAARAVGRDGGDGARADPAQRDDQHASAPGCSTPTRCTRTCTAMPSALNTTYEAMVQNRLKTCPAGRFADPSECGDLVAYLCSAQAGFMSGQNIVNDGGVYQGLF